MLAEIIHWLTQSDNPALCYRTQTELLGQSADRAAARDWILAKLPERWQDTKELWYTYYVTALAECGLSCKDVEPAHLDRALRSVGKEFAYGCADFMLLRALVMLGFGEADALRQIIDNWQSESLPDGGFLCARRLKGFKYTPKSCYKANVFALMALAEWKKARDGRLFRAACDRLFSKLPRVL